MLVGISPIIWRRLLLSSKTSIAQLHDYIQIAFVGSGEHLHRFRIHGKDYGIAYLGGISFEDNPHEVPLAHFRLHPRESFRYEHDFTAYWRVDIRLEEIRSPDRPILLVCTAGRGAAPGEEYTGALRICNSWIVTAATFRWRNGERSPRRCSVGWMRAGTVRRWVTARNSGRQSSA
jgi:hypothetical protein